MCAALQTKAVYLYPFYIYKQLAIGAIYVQMQWCIKEGSSL